MLLQHKEPSFAEVWHIEEEHNVSAQHSIVEQHDTWEQHDNGAPEQHGVSRLDVARNDDADDVELQLEMLQESN
jgi:hypothetical protein